MKALQISTALTGVRESSKALRRDRILECAKSVLREAGHECLSLRSLAANAGVSTPTIYNLLGNKHDVLLALADDLMSNLERAHHVSKLSDPIEKAEEVIDTTITIFESDEHYCRQLLLGLEAEALENFDKTFRRRGRRVALEDCERALELGYLRGDIESEMLGNRFADGFQQAQRAWLRGEVSLKGLRTEALVSCFVTLAADAVPKFRKRLVERIRNIQHS